MNSLHIECVSAALALISSYFSGPAIKKLGLRGDLDTGRTLMSGCLTVRIDRHTGPHSYPKSLMIGSKCHNPEKLLHLVD